MGTRRSFVVGSFASLLAAAGIAGVPAGAQDTVPVRASSAGTALELSLFGQGLTIGETVAAVDGTPAATAAATGILLGPVAQGTESADLTNPGDDQPTCSPIVLPPEVPAVDLSVACGLAAVAPDGPQSTASAGVASLSVSGTELLTDTPLSELPVQETVDELLGGLTPVFDGLAGLGLDAGSAVSQLLGGITGGGNLVTVELGPSTADAAATPDAATASSTAAGAVIAVVDRALLGLPPVLLIEVGASGVSVETNRVDGTTADPVFDPALVRVTIAPDIVTALGLPQGVIEVAPGQEVCLPLPDPLTSCITVAGGRVLDTDDGGKRGESEGVGLRLLTGLPEGGIVLNLAATSAEAAAAAPADEEQLPDEDRSAPPALAQTGGVVPMPVVLGLAAAGLAGLAATRRRLV